MNSPLQAALRYAFISGRPENYLEVGCADGDSLLYVIYENPYLITATVVDTWGSEFGGTGRGNSEHVRARMRGLSRPQVSFLDGDSHKVLPNLSESFDMVLIDGDHSFSGASDDLEHGWRLTKNNAWLVFDDTFHKDHLYLRALFEDFMREKEVRWFHIVNEEGGASFALKEGQ